MEASIKVPELAAQENGAPASSLNSLFSRKIVFHPARKRFNGFSSKPASDFQIETLNPGADQQRLAVSESEQAGGSRKRDAYDLFDSSLDPELTLRTTFRKIGAGLENLGNTCFLNSVLQCLTYTEPLAAYLQSGKHQNTCHVVGFCALCAIQKHVSRALQSTGRIVAPKDLVSNLRCISRNFRNARQEDAHEYMVNLLESMHKCCLPSGVQSESSSAYEKSLVHKIFGGRLRSRVKCRDCLHSSDKYDPFLDLSLEIIKADSLQRALQNFTAPEILDGGEKQYQCQNCNKKVQANKQLTVDKAPYVLTIHLKRFRAFDPGQKIDKKVHFVPKLDMKPFVSGPYEGGLKYTLYGVLVHCGWSTRSGHYYCFVRTSSGMWYSLDDKRVFQVSERTVLEQKAYMLFYVRDREAIPPKEHTVVGLRNTMNPNVGGIISSVFKQNGSVDGKLRGSENAVVRVQMDAIDSGISKFKHQKTELPVRNKGQLADSPVSTKGSFSGQPSGSSCPKTVRIFESLQPVDPHAPSAGNASNLEQKAVAIGFSVGEGVTDIGAGKDIRGTVIGNAEEPAIDSALERDSAKVNVALNGDSAGAQSGHLNDKSVKNVQGKVQCATNANGASKNANFSNSLSEPKSERSQFASAGYGSLGCSMKEASDGGEKKAVEFVESTVLVAGCGLEENRTPSIRRRMKLPKNRSKVMYIWLKPFKATLGLRRKKKHRKRKANAKNVEIIAKEKLFVKDSAPADLAPSTSETIIASSLVTVNHRKRKAINGVMKNVQETVGSTKASFDGEFSQRICQNGSVLAADESVGTHGFNSKSNQQDGRGTNSQNSMMHLLTQGLRETAVARWDDIGLNFPSEGLNNSKDMSIGYLLDEWDEEYDRGRRKKVRQSKHSFGGPNLFQQVARKKMHQKNVKVNHSMTGNHPLRI